MMISDVPLSLSPPPPPPSPIDHLETLINQLENLTLDSPIPSAISALTALSRSIPTAISHLTPSTNLHFWKLAFRIWNSCVDFHNSTISRGDRSIAEPQAKLRNAAADLLLVAGKPAGIPSPEFKAAGFFYKTGLLWCDLKVFDNAAGCFEKATDLTAGVGLERVTDAEERKLLLDVNLSRARTAWEVGDWNLTIALLNRSRNLLFGSPMCYRALAEQYLQFGKVELGRMKPTGSSDLATSPSKLLNEALDLCDKGMRTCKLRDENFDFQNLKGRILRLLAAERLQAEDYDGALRCVRVLREGGGKEEHPSVGFVAMRAWVGMKRIVEAEKELKGMLANKGVPESVCVSAAEVFLAAAGIEAAKGVLIGLVGRCRLGASAALRVVQGIVEGGGGGAAAGRARVVAELVSDERVVTVFAGDEVGKECAAMHAILWNYAAEHFRLKDYETAAELFEKSMLYIKHDEVNRPRRANCYRVLCLCHLGLSQLDRAQEFINEADKLQPTINCAFLKYKVYLQKGAEKEAISQVEGIFKCADFNPEYLTLSAHEAMASNCIPAAIASLSILLSLYSPGKTMPMPEVAVLRSIIQLLQKNHDNANELEILKYTRRVRVRISELGAEAFFVKGEIGTREMNWFAVHAWNMGLKSAKETKYESSIEFLEMASEFYSMRKESDENTAMVCKALILTVASMIANEEKKAAAMLASDIKKSLEMLDKASMILSSHSITAASSMILDDNRPLIEPGLFFLHTFNTYQILGRLSEDPCSKQLQLIKSFVSSSSKNCTPLNLLHLGLIASQAPRPNPEVAHFALKTCLSELLASPMPDYQSVSLTLRKLIGLAAFSKEKEDDCCMSVAYEVYRQAYRIVVGLKNGEYPREEGKWLAISAWNRSVVAARLGQLEVAIKWMRLGFDLGKHLKGMEIYLAGMEECLTNIEKTFVGGSSMEEVS